MKEMKDRENKIIEELKKQIARGPEEFVFRSILDDIDRYRIYSPRVEELVSIIYRELEEKNNSAIDRNILEKIDYIITRPLPWRDLSVIAGSIERYIF